MAHVAMPAGTPAITPDGHLTPELTDLLTAARDALDLPLADTVEDDQARAQLLDRRASDAQIIIAAALKGDDMASCAEQLRGWTAERPVNYTVWVPEQAEDGEPR